MIHQKKNKSFFVTFEGGEGAGKSTLIKKIHQSLEKRGKKVFYSREPGGTPLGEEVRHLLLHKKNMSVSPMAELMLFLASRTQHIEEVILPHLNQGVWVLCDRFNDSSIAYQGVARELGFDLTNQICQLACNHLKPDLTFILDQNPENGFKRIQKMDKEWDRLENLELSFHQKVQKGYHMLAQKEPKRIHLIDATQSIEEVFSKAWSLLEEYLEI